MLRVVAGSEHPAADQPGVAACLTWERPSVDVRWRLPLAVTGYLSASSKRHCVMTNESRTTADLGTLEAEDLY